MRSGARQPAWRANLDLKFEHRGDRTVRKIGEIIRRLNRELELTIPLAEQKLHFARQFADDALLCLKARLCPPAKSGGWTISLPNVI